MRVAITHPYSWPEVRRGAERIVVETSRALAGRGHDVTVFTAGSTADRSVTDGVRVVRLRRWFADDRRHERTFGYRVVPHLIAGRFDIVHAMMAWDGYCAARARAIGRYRVVFDEMGIPYGWYWANHPDRRIRAYLAVHADVYGCMSRHALDVLQRDWGRQGALIPGGVRLAEFSPSRHRDPNPTVLFSGALDEPRKGVADLLEAAALLSEEWAGLQVWLSGPGDPSSLLANAPDAGRRAATVLPLGRPDEQARRYQQAWVTALPSTSESFGLVLIESLASGTPIVVVNDAAPPELVTPQTGAVAEPGDPKSLAAALSHALELSRDPETSGRCRDFARRFDWDEEIAPLLENLYSGQS